MLLRTLAVLLLAVFASTASGAGNPSESVSSIVVRVEQRPTREYIVTLQNGQVWQQVDRGGQLELRRGDRIVLRKAGLDSFVLVSANGMSARVKRVH